MFFKIGVMPTTLLKRGSNTGVFLEINGIFKNIFFTEHFYSGGCFWQ